MSVAFEPHSRSRSIGIEEHRAGCRDERLALIEFVVGDAAAFEHPSHMIGDPLIADQFAIEKVGERAFGYIVLRGAEAAREDCHLALRHGPLQGCDDRFAVVAHRLLFVDDDPGIVEVAGNGNGVRIDDLSDEDLVADGNDRSFHDFEFMDARMTLRSAVLFGRACPWAAFDG